jgi:DNA-binding response OmpR family regulator
MRLLLIEDEEKVARFVIRGLEAERFAVDAATNGVNGLELATEYEYDLIILDWLACGDCDCGGRRLLDYAARVADA